MNQEESVQEELSHLFPDMPAKKDAIPPDGYFDQLPDQIIRSWKERHARQGTRVSLYRKWIIAAAVVSGIWLGLFLWMRDAPAHELLAEVSTEDIYQYIAAHIDEFAPYLAEEVPGVESSADESMTEFPSAEEIENYLMEELNAEEVEQLF